MATVNPYEYHNNTLGIQGRFLTYGEKQKLSHPESLGLIGEIGLRQKINRKSIIRLRLPAVNTPMLVQFDTLPYQWRELVTEKFGIAPKLIKKSFFESCYTRSMEAFNFYSYEFKFPDGSGLDADKIDEYTVNASTLEAIGKVYAGRRQLRTSLKQSSSNIWETITAESNRFRSISGHTLPENEQILRKKYSAFKREGYGLLVHKGFKNKSAQVVTSEMESLFNNMFSGMSDKPTYEELSRVYDGFMSGYVEVINNETGECYNPKDFTRVSNSTVYNYLSKWQNRIGNELARSGDRQKYMQKFNPYHSLKQAQYAGSIISIDDRQPPFWYDKNTRPWFYNGIDLGSEAFTCWVHGKSKDGIIKEFYRQMVRNYAQWGLQLPAEIECESSLNASFKESFLKEGNMFQYVRIEANNARGKRIERYYRNLRYGLEKKREGWLARPNALSEANQKNEDKNIIIPYDDIIGGCLLDIQTWNNSEHSKIKGKSRWEVFMLAQNPAIKPTNYHGILPFLGYKEKSSVNAGIIKFRRTEYLLGINGVIATGDKLIQLMIQAEGKEIDIYWLDDNFGSTLKAHVYIGNRFICEAIEKPAYSRARIERTPEDLVNRELMSKYAVTVESFGRRQKNSLEKLTVIDNRPLTIGNAFIMPGIRQNNFQIEQANILPNFDEENLELETDLIGSETSFKKELLIRF